MISALRAEFRKLLTVRSTYFIIILTALIVCFFAGFIYGFRADHATLASTSYLSGQITGAISAIAMLGAIVGLLLFGHEYRFSLIIYSLTSINSRTKFLLAKIAAVTCFSIVFTVAMAALSLLASIVGTHLHHLAIAPQSINFGAIWWRCLFYGWGYSMFALIIIALIRNQIGAIVAFFLIPSTVESLLSLLLKNNTKYLPFTALNSLIGNDQHTTITNSTHVAVITSLAYIIGGWIVAWVLFMRRDAN